MGALPCEASPRCCASTILEQLDTLARATTLNVALGNGDAHGKNFSLLHDVSGRLRLAPAYDLLSTRFYGDDRLAMHVDHVRRIDRVTTDRIVNEAMGLGHVEDASGHRH